MTDAWDPDGKRPLRVGDVVVVRERFGWWRTPEFGAVEAIDEDGQRVKVGGRWVARNDVGRTLCNRLLSE